MSNFIAKKNVMHSLRQGRRVGRRPQDRAEEVLRDGLGRAEEGQEDGGGHPGRDQGKEDEEDAGRGREARMNDDLLQCS